MERFSDELSKFHRWCRWHGLSYVLNYSEASDELETEVQSPAPVERLYMKRTPGLQYFMDAWMTKMTEAGYSPSEMEET